jgi:murein DD-endopeptidase MepM/ murein hydrolase activator NlpD
MYNPTNIQRDYVAYLEQQALDPFNTIYGSNNLVAPPGILDFSFELMFDRQIENANGSMPRGVLEDFDYFDLVVRGVVPDVQGPHLQDNGIMMINPRNVTIVFSSQLSVQGRPYRAAVQYTKFDHNMVPIRMVISISMKVFYFGKVREDFKFASTQQEATYAATVQYEQTTVQFEAVELSDLTTEGISFPEGESPTPFINRPAGATPPSNSGFILERPYNFPTHKDHHKGDNNFLAIDIGAAEGQPVYSPWDGKVVSIGYPNIVDALANGGRHDTNGGNSIVIQSDLVDGKQYSLYMAHFQSSPLVKKDDRLYKGQNIAFVGHTGFTFGNSPHVHCRVTDGDSGGVFDGRSLPAWDFMKQLEGG